MGARLVLSDPDGAFIARYDGPACADDALTPNPDGTVRMERAAEHPGPGTASPAP
ncbi:hypothetical protein EDD29_3251 [Actinocorallia herbida]|uniref:Uncharacterized protein n=1 Tax=Actinocorallia herbida TaxID=58109 RepID=A0A3N1CWN8_9ACTN|nr:hypothetical protein [Actinocorallia herbida]ROO85703.1 hypothetical protein EDD29_3251 [Actinocorallia herbida]